MKLSTYTSNWLIRFSQFWSDSSLLQFLGIDTYFLIDALYVCDIVYEIFYDVSVAEQKKDGDSV